MLGENVIFRAFDIGIPVLVKKSARRNFFPSVAVSLSVYSGANTLYFLPGIIWLFYLSAKQQSSIFSCP
jgi:hypothetical protein